MQDYSRKKGRRCKKNYKAKKNTIIDAVVTFDCVDHNKLWKFLKEMGIPDHLICLLRNLYAGQEVTVRTGHGERLVPNSKKSTS